MPSKVIYTHPQLLKKKGTVFASGGLIHMVTARRTIVENLTLVGARYSERVY